MKDKQAVGRQVEDEFVPGGLWAFQGVGAETRVGEKVKKKILACVLQALLPGTVNLSDW